MSYTTGVAASGGLVISWTTKIMDTFYRVQHPPLSPQKKTKFTETVIQYCLGNFPRILISIYALASRSLCESGYIPNPLGRPRISQAIPRLLPPPYSNLWVGSPT